MATAAARLSAAFSLAVSLAAGFPDPSVNNVEWLSVTPFDGSNYADGLPLGNGRVVVLAWPNATSGGVDFYVRSAMALHSDTSVMTIARVAVALQPNFCSPVAYFNTTLHLEDASISVLCGGSSFTDYVLALKVFVDANTDAVVVTAASRDGATTFSLSASLTSVRPAFRFGFGWDFNCPGSSSGPDVIIGPSAWPPPSPFNFDAVGLLHANNVAAGDSSAFNFTMWQQGLAPLLANFSDPLDGRIFGAGLRGGAGVEGDGAPLVASPGSSSSLQSAMPAPAFAMLLAVRVDPAAGGDEAAFLRALAAELNTAIAPSARAAGNLAAWARGFWQRSWFVPALDPPPPPPPPPPSNATLGGFLCGDDLTERQTITIDAATGTLTFPLGLCLLAPYDGWVDALPCNASSQPWRLTPCTAPNCNATEDFWVQSPFTYPNSQVLGFPGANPPWLLAWTPDVPTGACKNEIFFYNSTDSTVRTRNCNSQNQCLTVNHTYPPSPPPPITSVLAAQYARTRFVNAVQGGGGVNAPIPFNGMLFTNLAGSNVDYRQWGANHWFQNTRFPYETMLAGGDVEQMRVVLDWVSSFAPLLSARTSLLLPGESGLFATETVFTFGLYQEPEYDGCTPSSRPAGYPVWLEGAGSQGGWVRYDYGGNGFAEAGLMAIDYYWATLDTARAAQYVPIATGYVDFYMSHYSNRTDGGKLMIWPSQVLETNWCEWPASPSVNFDPSKCNQNDLPNVAAVRSLVRGLLSLPPASGLLTAAQRASYTGLEAILPPLPLDTDGTYAMAAHVGSDCCHNSEGPWLFGSHPYRLETVGTAIASGVNLSTAQATYRKQGWFTGNSGWSYGTIVTAFLGFSSQAYAMVLDRARQPPPAGYRFPAFAQHYQDYEPSADHFSVMNTAVNAMLLQNGEDGDAGSIVLLPAWPCEIDVSFKLWGAKNTSVEVVWAGGALVSLVIDPPERASAVTFAPCNTTESRESFGLQHFL